MPWFLFLVAAAMCLVVAWRTRRRGIGIVAAVVLGMAAAVSWPGQYYIEKMLTDLALPLGFVWLLLLGAVIAAAVCRYWMSTAALGVIWTCLSAAGSNLVAEPLVRSLERPYLANDPMEAGRFDAVFLLGGGAMVDHNGGCKVSSSGDRIVVAARLLDVGRTPIIVCTGDDFQPASNVPTAAKASAEVLIGVGVPKDQIRLAGGLNTKTEMIAIRALVEEEGWNRIGLITSAWHMRRAERLAREAGLEFEPLPADFRSSVVADLSWWDKFRRSSLIPNAGAIELTHLVVKEHLAQIAGR